MCLLNGDVGGQLFAAHEFSTIYTTHSDGIITKEKIPIKTIIKEAIHTYAQEPYGNIIINDLESCGVELIDYTCSDAKMYIFEQRINDTDPWISQICFDGSWMADRFEHEYSINNEQSWDIYFDADGVHYHLLKRIDPVEDIDTTAGYRATDLIYPDDLVVSVGGNITQMLDQIVKMLGEFEYFYDIDGRFIFQRKKIYFNSSWSNAITTDGETYYADIASSSPIAYNFLSGYLINSFQNKPNLGAIRNDYSVWGKRKNSSGSELQIHMRYAIDGRPMTYWSLIEKRLYVSNAYRYELITGWKKDSTGQILYDSNNEPIPETVLVEGNYDWRELIYQMARDNLKATNMVDSLTKAMAHAPDPYYHYSYYKVHQKAMDQRDFRICYIYNSLTKKFELLEKKDNEEDDGQSVYLPGEQQFNFGDAIQIAITAINNDMRLGRLYSTEDDHIRDLSNVPEHVHIDYDYRTNNWSTKYYAILYSQMTAEEKSQAIADLAILREDENNVISHYTNKYLLEDMRREIDEWSDTFRTGYDAYYADMLAFWPLLYRSSNVIEFMYDDDGKLQLDESGQPQLSESSIDSEEWAKWCDNNYWNPELITYNHETKLIQFKNPEELQFWLEFIEQDTDPALWQYSVTTIGRRSKSINDDQVSAIYFRDTPLLLFISEDFDNVEGEELLNYVRINLVPPISNYFRISSQGKSAKSVIDSLMYEGTYYQESITLNTIPIYYLSPNTRIQVQDDSTGINGEYLIKSYQIQLNYDGLMSITATRVVDSII